MTSTPPPDPLRPSILCLHGGGTNATIFHIQLIRLTRLLDAHFNFIYLTAPHSSPPGPEVLPMFDGCGPFMRWTGGGWDGDLEASVEDMIYDTIRRKRLGPRSEVVGVLGFSQGAKLAAGLLVEQQLHPTRAEEEKFKFAVLCNGVSQPMITAKTKAELGDRREMIRVPSVHVVGLQDKFCGESRRLFHESFDPETSTLLEFDNGHRIPALEADSRRIADEILWLYRQTCVLKS